MSGHLVSPARMRRAHSILQSLAARIAEGKATPQQTAALPLIRRKLTALSHWWHIDRYELS